MQWRHPCTLSLCLNLSLQDFGFPLHTPQVLDGIPIEAAEQAAAKSKYSGRLTRDFLEERLGHAMFDRIRDMDCSGLKVWAGCVNIGSVR